MSRVNLRVRTADVFLKAGSATRKMIAAMGVTKEISAPRKRVHISNLRVLGAATASPTRGSGEVFI